MFNILHSKVFCFYNVVFKFIILSCQPNCSSCVLTTKHDGKRGFASLELVAHCLIEDNFGEDTLQEPVSMNEFLISVEKKAFHMVNISVNDSAEALDIVQDAMMKFATSYSSKPYEQWKALFYRIVQNRIVDFHRKQKVRRIMLFWQDEETVSETIDYPVSDSPDYQYDKLDQQSKIIDELRRLPAKQQQCFLLRTWEGMSVKETANIMKCSEGSVKTHFSRANAKLKDFLEQYDEQ